MTHPAPRAPRPQAATPRRARRRDAASHPLGRLLTLGLALVLASSVAAPSFAGTPATTARVGTTVGAEAASTPGTAEPNDDLITWSVRPAPTKAEPIRNNYSYDVRKGQTIRDTFRVRNYTDETLPLTIYASDGFNAPDGALDLLKPEDKPTDVGSWIRLETEKLNIAPMKFVDVDFTMTVPELVEPGDHIGGIVTSYVSPSVDGQGSPIQLDRRLGARVQVRVEGPLQPGLAVTGLSTRWDGPTNPVGRGSMTTTYTVTNTGNVRLSGLPSIRVKSPLGFPSTTVRPPQTPELFPNNSITLTHVVDGVWPTFLSTTEVKVNPVAAREGDTFDRPTAGSASTRDLTIPWSLMILVALLTLGYKLWRRRQDALRQSIAAGAAAPAGDAADLASTPSGAAAHLRQAQPHEGAAS